MEYGRTNDICVKRDNKVYNVENGKNRGTRSKYREKE